VYIALGILLWVTALIVLGSAALLLWDVMRDWRGTGAIFLIADRLMFVLVLIEILHTVRGSVRSGPIEGRMARAGLDASRRHARASRCDRKCLISLAPAQFDAVPKMLTPAFVHGAAGNRR
jgi:hypothetical protein